MGQERLSLLALMSIERAAVDDLFSKDIDTIIRKFVDDPHRRINQKSWVVIRDFSFLGTWYVF